MNETLATIFKRRSIRRYKREQVKESELALVLEAGQHAPSGGNNQSCHILVVQKPAVLAKLIELTQNEFKQMSVTPDTYKSLANAINASQKGNFDFTKGAPTVIIVANRKNYGNAMADSACMLENMMIAATSIGLGSCWLNQLHWLTDHPPVRSYLAELGLKEEEKVCGSLALGYSDMAQMPPLERKGNLVTMIK